MLLNPELLIRHLLVRKEKKIKRRSQENKYTHPYPTLTGSHHITLYSLIDESTNEYNILVIQIHSECSFLEYIKL